MEAYKKTRKFLRPLKRFWVSTKTKLVELPYRFRKPAMGSAEWLVHAEVVYGGLQTGVERNKVSPQDQRSVEQLSVGGMIGGDRMLHHGYASVYAKYLAPFLNSQNLTLAEFGILKGSGLAIWCDLFPSARVLGFDIDLGHFERNRAALVGLGAFKNNTPDLHEYDQLVAGGEVLSEALHGTIDIVINDGLHSIDAILQTWRSVEPFLSPRFVYIIEDFPNLMGECGDAFAGYECQVFSEITVIQRVNMGDDALNKSRVSQT